MNSDGLFDWQATLKTDTSPYICVSKCQRGFKWFDRVGKCLMVVEDLDVENEE